MKKTFAITAFTALISTCALTQVKDTTNVNLLDEVVISDTKFAQSKEKTGKVIEIITLKDLEKKSGQSLANVLNQVAGVEINGNQSFNGKNLSSYIRGGRNKQVVVYIDGVPVNDASAIGSDFDLRLLPIEQVERIEVMKGASSTLYGTGAATGVINITLKKPFQKKISGNAYWNFGTQNTSETHKLSAQDVSQGFSVGAKNKQFSFFTQLNHTHTTGISEAKGINFENDIFSRININQKVGISVLKDLLFDLYANYDKIKNTFDNPYGGINYSSDDVYNNSVSEQFRIGINPKYTYNKGELKINAGYLGLDRNINQYNSWTSSVDIYKYFSKNVSIDVVNKYAFSEKLFALVGLQYNYFSMAQYDAYTNISFQNAKFNIADPYFTVVYNSDFGFNLNSGLRLNTHSIYGSHWVYNINPNYNIKELPVKIMASYSTAYITPSLYQLFSVYGNLLLQPEENSTVEVGFETQLFSNKVVWNTVGFYREEKNTVDFFTNPNTFISSYTNIEGTYAVKGIESSLQYKVSNKIQLNANYTFTQTPEDLNRLIPKHKINATLQYNTSNRFNCNLSYQFVDKREDAFFDMTFYNIQPVTLSNYQLWNTNFNYELIENRMKLFFTITNIFNTDFEEAVGYNTRGRNFKIGINISL